MEEAERSSLDADAPQTLLKTRYHAGLAYTSITPNVLLSIMPPHVPPVYDATLASTFAAKSSSSSPALDSLYGVAERAYHCAVTTNSSAVIALTGESGSGKTRNATVLIEYLARRGGSERLASLLMHANVVLEAFGCADVGSACGHASRFERETILHYRGDGMAVGASVTTFALEDWRVVSTRRSPTERTFAVFYQLLAGVGVQQLRALGLIGDDADVASPADFTATRFSPITGHTSSPLLNDPLLTALRTPNSYLNLLPRELLNQSLSHVREGINFCRTMAAMEALGISETERSEMMHILAAILQLSNVTFEGERIGAAVPSNPLVLGAAARLLGVLNGNLLEPTLVRRLVRARTSYVHVTLDAHSAHKACNALMVNLYARLFNWLLRRINDALGGGVASPARSIVCVTDFAGFSSERHSLTQLFYNHATDSLYLSVGRRHLVAPQQDYARRGLEWTFIDPGLNEAAVAQVAQRPDGVFCGLEEECRERFGCDAAFTLKLNRRLRCDLATIEAPTGSLPIRHNSGLAFYTAEGWLQQNNPSSLNSDLVALMQASTLALVRDQLLWHRPLLQLTAQEQRSGFMCTTAISDAIEALTQRITNSAVYTVHCVRPCRRPGIGAEFDHAAVHNQLAPLCLPTLLHLHKHGYPVNAALQSQTDAPDRHATVASGHA